MLPRSPARSETTKMTDFSGSCSTGMVSVGHLPSCSMGYNKHWWVMIASQPQSSRTLCCLSAPPPQREDHARTSHAKVSRPHFPSVLTSTARTSKTMTQKRTCQLTRPEKTCFAWLYLLKPSPDHNHREAEKDQPVTSEPEEQRMDFVSSTTLFQHLISNQCY